jgi:tetratricopeptide (TPR) repeat protein
MPPTVLVCTGFHRSGTSLTAQWLHRAGLPLGDQLLPADSSQPDGHFEDRRLVDLDAAWLQRQGTNWLFHDEVALDPDAAYTDAVARYIAARDRDGVAWGIKDPRLALALPAWDEALGERGRFVLVIRHWAECAQSLLQRHSRELAAQLPRPVDRGDDAHFRFWREPNIAYESWLAYSARMLEFAAFHPERCALVSTRGVAGIDDLTPLVVERLGVPLAQPRAKPRLKPGLLSHGVNAATLLAPPIWLRRNLDAMWADLLSLCELRAPDEDVAWTSRRMPAAIRQGLDERVASRFPDRSGAPAATPAGNDRPEAGIAGDLALLELLPAARKAPRALALARRAFTDGRLDDAATLARAGLPFAAAPQALHALLGDIAAAGNDDEAALAAYRAALAAQPGDALVIRTVRCLMRLRRWQAALDLLDPLLARVPDHVDAQVCRARCLDVVADPEAAVISLQDFPREHAGIQLVRSNLTMEFDPREGMRLYREAVRLRLADKDLLAWLAGACAALPSAAVWDVFVEAVYGHWAALLGREAALERLGLAPPPG